LSMFSYDYNIMNTKVNLAYSVEIDSSET